MREFFTNITNVNTDLDNISLVNISNVSIINTISNYNNNNSNKYNSNNYNNVVKITISFNLPFKLVNNTIEIDTLELYKRIINNINVEDCYLVSISLNEKLITMKGDPYFYEIHFLNNMNNLNDVSEIFELALLVLKYVSISDQFLDINKVENKEFFLGLLNINFSYFK